MIDHVSIGVADLDAPRGSMRQRSRRSGYQRLVTRPATIGFGKTYPEFWINLRADMAPVAPESGTHICLRAKATGDVDAFQPRRSAPAAAPTARRACARMIACSITPPSSSIPTATASRR